jgi:PD-(D/E)XK nuclease superfamily protein
VDSISTPSNRFLPAFRRNTSRASARAPLLPLSTSRRVIRNTASAPLAGYTEYSTVSPADRSLILRHSNFAQGDSVDPFVAQLAHLCTTHRARAKWVFVPTHAVGCTLGERLALEGTDWANLRFVTPLDIALQMGAPFLVERGINPSEDGLGPSLMMRLLLDLPEEEVYFRPLADQPAMAQALWSTVHELRMAGVRASQILPEAFESRAKYSEFHALVKAYENFLATEKRGDFATVYEEATKHPEWSPIKPNDCWTEFPETHWAPLQRSLIDSMPGERVVPRTFEIVGSTLPRRLHSANVERVPAGPQRSPLAFLMAPEPDQPVLLKLFHAGGRDAEIEEVFRCILASGLSLDQIEIACATDECASLVWEKACRYEWPITIGPGVPAAVTRPGRALLGFCSWIESDFTASVLRRLLESGDLTLGSIEEPTPSQSARLLVKAEAGWGRGTYDFSLRGLVNRYRALAADADEDDQQREAFLQKAGRAERLLAWTNELLASIPVLGNDEQVAIQDVINATVRFLDVYTRKMSALDGSGASALHDALTELRALGSFRCPMPLALRFVRNRVETVSVGRDRARPGHLHVSRLVQAGLPNRNLLFVVGLEEGHVFPAAVQDPVLLDSERERIHTALQHSSDRIQEAVHAVLARLAMVETRPGKEVWLSYSCRDLREYREAFPSWLMLQAYRLQRGDPSKSYPDLKTALGAPKSWVPDSAVTAVSDVGWWLHGLKLAGEAGKASVLLQYPMLAQGSRADEARQTAVFGEYDGFVPAAGKVLDPCVRERPTSATQLQKAAECPFRYFLEYGLGAEPVDEGERDTDVWLDPLLRGAELHDFYAAVLVKCQQENRKPNVTTDLVWVRDRANKRLDILRIEFPPPSHDVFEREKQEFLADVELFLKSESELTDSRTPVALEVSFGRAVETSMTDPLAQPEPVVIDLGKGLRLRLAGRIDRIDQIGPSSFEVIDYKTGRYFEADWKGTFAGGRRLQHALYGVAAIELLKRKYRQPKIVRGVYYFASGRGQLERTCIDSPSKAMTTAVLSDLRQVIAAGTFIRTSNEQICKWCDFTNACGAKASQKAATKQDDPKLDAYRRLVAHE